MSDQRLRILIDAQYPGRQTVRGAAKDLDQLGKSTGGAAQEQQKWSASSQKVFGFLKGAAVGAVAAAGYAMVRFGQDALRVSMDFEASMSNVGAVSGATEGQLAELSAAAKDMGATTVFSATQAAEGMRFLAMAGFETDQIIGALPGTLQLAAAANLDLGRSADIVSNILTGYGKDVEDLAHVNDVLVKAFTSANVDLGQLGDAMKFVGPVASGMGIQFEEAAAAIALMGDAGIQGSMAGTALRGALVRLATPTKEVTETLGRLGVNVKDSSGELLSLEDIVRQLERSGATTADMMVIFGQRAGPALAALVDRGADALRDFTNELENSGGIAEEVAGKQLDNLKGDVTLLNSAMDGLKITIGDGVNPELRELVENLTVTVSWLNENYEAINRWGTGFERVRTAITTAGFTELSRYMKDNRKDTNNARQATEDLAGEIYLAGGTYADFREEVGRVMSGTVDVTEAIWDAAAAHNRLERAAQTGTDWDRNFRESVTRTAPAVDEYAISLDTANDRLAYAAVVYRDAQVNGGAYEVTADQVAAAELRRKDAHDEGTAALQRQREAFNKTFAKHHEYIVKTEEGIESTYDWREALWEAAAASDIGRDAMIEIAQATQDYTEGMLEAILKTTAMQEAVEKVVEGLRSGAIPTVGDAIEALEIFEGQLDKDYTIQFDFESLMSTEGYTNRIMDRIREIAKTHHIHFDITQKGTIPGNVLPPGTTLPPGSPIPRARGGRMSPGQAYLVGDDNGRMTPYSEIIVPDQGGYVMNAQQAAAVVSQQTSTVTIEQGAIVINTVPGMNEQAIAANVLTEINRQLGQRAHAQMRI